ncbi:MAG: SDR family NAD(P)-dependent oxidoreductase [Proteobacteria bacterium]|nr:SDR family NAD(P)-dependent oxidoreductase [Pseudomonadota bacterium]
MRVLVTGGTGFVGAHTARALLAAGHGVRLYVRDREKAVRLYRGWGLEVPECVVGDIADEGAVAEALSGCDGVVHAAALVSLKARDAERVYATNTRGVASVIGGAVRRGLASIVYVSSVSALFVPGQAIPADAPVAPARSAYGRSKAECERMVRRWQEEGAPIRTTYPTGIVGPDDPGLSEANHAVRTFLRDTMVMTSSGFQAVDVRDLAQLQVALLKESEGPRRVFAGGRYLAWEELARVFDELVGRRVRRVPVSGGLMRIAGRVADVVRRVWDFDFPLTGEAMEIATRWVPVPDDPALDALGVQYRPVHETYGDTARWLWRAGHLSERQVGALAHPVERAA